MKNPLFSEDLRKSYFDAEEPSRWISGGSAFNFSWNSRVRFGISSEGSWGDYTMGLRLYRTQEKL